MKWAGTLLSCGLVCTLATPGAAQAALEVDWEAPANCPRPPGLEEPLGDSTGSATVLLLERPAGWVVTVMFFEPAGLRRVSARSCEQAIQTAVLLLRLGAAAEAPPAREEQVVTPLPPPETAPPWRLTTGLGVALDLVSLPRVEPRAAVSGSLARGSLRGTVDVRFGWPTPLTSGTQVSRLVEAQLGGCADFRLGRVSGGPCLAISGGSWGVVQPGFHRETWVLGAGAHLRASLELVARLELEVLAGLRANLRRPAPFTTAGTVFTTPWLTGEFQIVLGWRW